MQRILLSLCCALAFCGTGALAQQQQSSPATDNPTGGTLTERARQAAETIGEKTKQAAEKAREKTKETAGKSKAETDDKSAADSPAHRKARQMQDKADADYKAARAKCASIEPRQNRTLCEKQATAAHANAEVQVERAKLAAQRGDTATMGAGKVAR